MKNKCLLFFFLLFGLVFSQNKAGAYTITGTFRNVSHCFYPKVYLAVIDNINGFYTATSSALIASAPIDAGGNFTLSGDDLPDDLRVYRLYVTEDSNINTSVIVGSHRNYLLLVLNNNAEVTLQSSDFCENLAYRVHDNIAANNSIQTLQYLLQDYMQQYMTATTESKKAFITNRKRQALKKFINSTPGSLAALWAVTELDIDSVYHTDHDFLIRFAKVFATKNSPLYAGQLSERIRQLDAISTSTQPNNRAVVYILSILLFCSLVVNVLFVIKRKNQQPVLGIAADSPLSTDMPGDPVITVPIAVMTIKEREILTMIHEGLSNKEIADRLHIETSTVKTHVSRIYQKTGIKSRKEVAGIVKQMQQE